MIDVPGPFTLSVVYMTTDAMPSICREISSAGHLRDIFIYTSIDMEMLKTR